MLVQARRTVTCITGPLEKFPFVCAVHTWSRNHMRFRPALLALAVAAATSPAAAQTVTQVKLVAPNAILGGQVTSYGYYAGLAENFYLSPYSGDVNYVSASNPGTTYNFNCVDFFHDVQIGDVWTVNATNLGAVAANTQTLADSRAMTTDGFNSTDALTLYKEAAWLTLQYTPDPAADPTRTVAIQSAIWALFNYAGHTAPVPSYALGNPDYFSSVWLTRAVAGGASLTNTDLQGFTLLSDQNNGSTSKQEFLIHTTPEPATLGLVFTGFAGLAGAVNRRRKRVADDEQVAV